MRTVLAILVVVVSVLALLWILQRRLIYFPAQNLPPVDAVLPGAEEITFRTEDGLELQAWFRPAGPGSGPAVIVFNGNGGNRAGRAPLAEALGREGYSVLLVDYRGYGGNPGAPTEPGLRKDAAAAVSWLEDRREVDPTRIAYFGESLGAAVAIGLAVDRPPAALVLRSPFTNLVDMGRLHYPYLPVGWMLRDRYDSLGRVTRVETPILVIAGEEDRLIPISQSRRLYEAAGRPKRFVAIRGAGHNHPDLFDGERMIAELTAFLEEHS